ncbi:MAG: dynamin family protein [Paludibacteraceae bacterium]|nr:dynamin family protein [Paludibacteraceae bacterium]
MALTRKKTTATPKQQIIKVNPYEIQDNVLDLMGQIAAARPSNTIGEYWSKVDNFFFHDESTSREVVEDDKKVMRNFSFRDYFYQFRSEFGESDFLRIAYNLVNSLSRELQSAENSEHTQIVIAGGFSAGKSSFLNKLTGYGDLLPTGVEPVSVVPTYLRCSKNQSEVRVQGLNSKNAIIDLDRNVLDGIKHSNGSSCHFASVLEKLFVTVPANPTIDGLAFIDTPGYDNSDTANSSNGKTDKQTTQESLEEGQVLIWLVDAEKGALRKEDIEMIKNFEGKKIIIFNKADKKGSECKKIVTTAYQNIKGDIDESDIIDILAYSTLNDEIYFSKNAFSSISSLLSAVKSLGNGFSEREHIIQRIETMFDNEIEWTKDAIEHYSKLYESSLDDKKAWTDALKSWEDAEKENKKWAKNVIKKSYDDILSAADDLRDVASDVIDNYRDLISDSWGYVNSKFSSSESLERILNLYGDKFDGFVEQFNRAIDYSYYKKESRNSLVDSYNDLYDWRVNRLKGFLEESKGRSLSQLTNKQNQEKYLEDITNFKSKLIRAIRSGIKDYEKMTNSASKKASLSDETNITNVFVAIDKDDIKSFTRCFVSGINMTDCNAGGYSPLTYAVTKGNHEMVKFLLEHGADPTAYDNRGYNAFHTAVENQLKDMCEMLLLEDPDLVDSSTREGEGVAELLDKNTFKNWMKSKM